ncbi:NAD(P)-dependent oxidoreductase [Nonomuraea sp. B10E15]|uniref:NAD(P)-dependent oxidoreductase n=1 Tax=Nonomuraea sp. B10E15 TaxID=3153560 RepID=UPI00325D15EA
MSYHEISDRSPRIAVLGLGAMGMPMATRLHQAFPVTVFDVNDTRKACLVAEGATDAPSPAEAAAGADVVLLAVRDQRHVEQALFGDGGAATGLRPGSLVILTSTVGPQTARDVAGRLARDDIALVDAPISGGPARAGTGDLLIVVGASEEAFLHARPVLDQLASTLIRIGSAPGDGQALKAINQLLAGVHIAAAAEAVALARGLGLDLEAVLQATTSGAAASFMLADRGPRMIDYGEDDAPVRSRLDIFVKDLAIVADLAAATRVPIPVAAAAQQLFLLGERSGLGAADDSSLTSILFRRASPPRP